MNDDMQFQIECLSSRLAEMLMENYGWDIQRSLDELYTSETFRKICDKECGLYYESPVYVYSYLKNEIETGKAQ